MTLTSAEYLYYRRLTGVNTAELTDAMIQTAYDAALVLEDDAYLIKARTVVDMLQQMRGQYLKVIDVRGEVESEARNVIWDRLTEQLEYWSGEAGLGGGGNIGVGSITYNLNFSEDDIENTWP